MASATAATISDRGAVASALAPTAEQAGHDALNHGGNAVDAAVAAALCVAVTEPASCGIGGYGTHMVFALANGEVISIEANSLAPRSAHPDMFGTDATGQVPGKINSFGWLAAGVPGTLAGLELALDRYGTKRLAEVLAPAIHLARKGFKVNERFADFLRNAPEHLKTDPASQQIYFRNKHPLQVGSRYHNPELARMLDTLAQRGSVDSFYRGDIARHIVSEFQSQGGIVTEEDFAAYQAREVKPIGMDWDGYSIYTAPLTAGGVSTLQALTILKTLNPKQLPNRLEQYHATLEALRLAWRDRFLYLGDPDHLDVPVASLLTEEYAGQLADQVLRAVKDHTPLVIETDSYEQSGTVHVSVADSEGNLVALTLTHGEAFGACVTVDGLGLTLGHGLSRFDPRPGHANSIGAHKRPLNNMTPTVVLRDGRPVLALGGRGGRRIPNALLSNLLGFVAEDRPMVESIDLPRMHTEGDMRLSLDDSWGSGEAAYFGQMDYEVTREHVSYISAVSFDPASGSMDAAWR